MSQQTIIAIGVIGSFAVSIVGGIALGLPAEVILFLAILLCIVFAAVYMFFSTRNIKKAHEYARYSIEDKELKLFKRGKDATYHVDVVAELTGSLNYNPAEITYTAVTIGSATVGNIDYKDESYSFGNIHKSNKYRLNYNWDGTGDCFCPIYTILLDDSLIEEAKKDAAVSKYLLGNKLYLYPDVKLTDADKMKLEAASKYGKDNVAVNVFIEASQKWKLSKWECEQIKSWIEGNDY